MNEETTKVPGREFRARLFGQDAVEQSMRGATPTLAPWITEMTDRALFEDIWQADGLATRDRSIVTIAALAATGRTNELRAHLRAALRMGVSREELVGVIGQLTFYAGLPVVHAALAVARDVFEDVHEAD